MSLMCAGPEPDVIRQRQCATQQRGNNTYSAQFDDSGVFTFIFSIFINFF